MVFSVLYAASRDLRSGTALGLFRAINKRANGIAATERKQIETAYRPLSPALTLRTLTYNLKAAERTLKLRSRKTAYPSTS